MIKHKYVPWTAGKKKFQGKDDKGDVSFDSKESEVRGGMISG